MIEIRDLTKRFGKLVAVNGVSFGAGRSEALAILGANGAGKSTLIKCMLGLLDYSGDIELDGIDVRKHPKEARSHVGYLPQEPVFYDMRAGDIIRFFARLRRSGEAETNNLLNEVGLSEHARKRASELSGGMRQRLSFAIALLSSPPTLLLDEPSSNLDARARGEFLQLVKEYKEKGKTVVFSSHRLDEVNYLADRVIVMKEGKLVMDEEPGELRRRLGTRMNISVPEVFVSRASSVFAEAGIIVHGKNGMGLMIEVRGGDSLYPLKELMSRGIPVLGFSIEEPTMKSILEGAAKNGA